MQNYRVLVPIGVLAFVLSAWVAAPLQNDSFKPYEQKIPNTPLSFGMVPIPGGTFIMGSDNGKPDEAPKHEVSVDPFWMGTHEVTWDLFELFLDKNFEAASSEGPLPTEVDGLTRPSIPYLDMTFGMGKHGMPAIGMTQYGAIQFCRWLYVKTGIFYRLPTEAEWEFAARAGSNTEFFFGSDPAELDQYAWYGANSGDATKPVGKKKPNPWGLYDIYGNVNEWTNDHYDANLYKGRSGKVTTNPVLTDEELYPKVLRGGSYRSGAEELRSAHRVASTAQWKRIDPQIPKSQWWFPEAPFVGMRVVRPLNPPSQAEIEAYYGSVPQEDY